jgi:leucyl aminopeptidase (aminopeptidase T)
LLVVNNFSFPIYMNGNREHVRSITVQVATEEEEQQQEEEEARAHDEAAARQWQQQAGHGHDLQEAPADAIAWMNEAVARRNPNAEVAAAGFSWRNRVVADVAPEDGDGDGAVVVAAGDAPAGSSSVAVKLGVGILVFIVAALVCLIM